ncbi:uncharacterized protein A1O5_11469 [Cladophialophora psammophila CBS 110553]|uniref:Uncharacterized protein n=1 Tax=Cladophialophora psammophila CBS 110553 TaxID=1182543 RepID=W9WEK7_9EURO|nr:uncharacterized protein A1O5_11469 [Cladophialophora psammophila CBS 110553]EXJ63420.1 hypothetical protein A1O5_11469 [Cladophialophora psammophila CBS 110553]
MALPLWVSTQLLWVGHFLTAVVRSEVGYVHPCAKIADIYDLSNGDVLLLSPELAYECLSSVPVKQEDAQTLVDSLRGYLEIQSTLDYLAFPPSGWLFPPVDIIDTLSQIQQKVAKNEYSSEYDLQIDLHTMALLGKDDHFTTKGPILGALTFHRAASSLISLSEDGVQNPLVYLFDDDDHPWLRSDAEFSPIIRINGFDVQEYIQIESLTGTSQDPDALYNGLMYPYGLLFDSPEFYPGPYTNLTFHNGSTKPFNNYAQWEGNLTGIVDGYGMYERFFAVPDSIDESGASAYAKPRMKRQLPAPDVLSDDSGFIKGYWGDSVPTDVAVIVISSFSPGENGSSDVKFQKALQKILASATENGKKKLIIDLQGNGGGSVELCLDTMVQLFPDTTPDTKSNMRASGAQQAVIQYYSEMTQIAEDKDPTTELDKEELEAEEWYSPFAYQAVMSPVSKNFDSVNHFYGPYREGPGYFTSYFQENYTNNDYSLVEHTEMNITQATPGAQWPFSPENMIILTDGICASACSIFVEYLKNKFQVMSIVVGGRPQTGPMQTIGGVRGSRVFNGDWLEAMVAAYLNHTDAHPGSGDPTFEHWDYGPRNRFGTDGLRVNSFNAYRMGEVHNTPLHFAYEAADCRIWYTPEMIEDITVLWNRVAELAFSNRVGDVITSPYCVEGSTKHPTSISGGVKQGELGPQTPPATAFPQYTGWIVNGTKITQDNLGRAHRVGAPSTYSSSGGDDDDTPVVDPVALQNFKDLCSEYITEEEWFLKLMCLAVQ